MSASSLNNGQFNLNVDDIQCNTLAATTFAVSGVTAATGNLTLSATIGNVAITTVAVGTDIGLTAIDDVTIIAGDNITLSSVTGNVVTTGNYGINSADILVTPTGDLIVLASNNIDMTATTGNVSLTAGNITLSSLTGNVLTTGNYSIDSADISVNPTGDLIVLASNNINMTATTGNVSVASTAGDVLVASAAGTLSLNALDDNAMSLLAGVVNISAVNSVVASGLINIGSTGNMTLDSNLANITLQTSNGTAFSLITLNASGGVAIGGAAVPPNVAAGQISLSGGATLVTGTGASAFTLLNNANVNVTQYLPIKIGATEYWLPLIATLPT